MSKRHDSIFEDVLRDMAEPTPPERSPARFLKRRNALADSGQREEKLLRWVDPASCVMWARHNRAYDLLTENNCADLIDSLKAQGRQEFPAIVRKIPPGQGAEYEVICGARRHFAVSWLRANNYPQFFYLIEIRDLTDEEAFRLADLENRDRADLSDYERACDYLQALELYYGGRQKGMAARLEVSEAWLSRYLQLARLPTPLVQAWPQITELRELHARRLKPWLANAEESVLAEARSIAAQQAKAREGLAAFIPVPRVLARLKSAAHIAPPAPGSDDEEITIRKFGDKIRLEFSKDLSETALRAALEVVMKRQFPKA